jgi:N-acetylmuramoyl-L-alanine amidase
MLRLSRRNGFFAPCAAGLCALLATSVFVSAQSQVTRIDAIRFWSFGDVTRVALETRGEYQIHTEQLANPPRLFFDLHGLKLPAAPNKGVRSIQVGDQLVKQIRLGETTPGVTRVVFDLETEVEFTSSQLANPDRLVIEIRAKSRKGGEINVSKSRTGPKRFDNATDEAVPGSSQDFAIAPLPALTPQNASRAPGKVQTTPVQITPVQTTPRRSTPDLAALYPPPAIPYLVPMLSQTLRMILYGPTRISAPPYRRPSEAVQVEAATARKNQATKSSPKIAPADDLPPLEPGAITVKPTSNAVAQSTARPAGTSATTSTGAEGSASAPAKIDSSGNRSLVRVFGLKMGKIVIDAGHGGHDTGTIGPHGLLEKDLVLDVALRLGQLIQTKMGSQVVYTRSDDMFIPLEQRTQIANDEKADLFISIHANSAPISAATGVETYYFNFTTEKSALDLATRENATADSSIHELNDLLQKAVMKAKVEESREFAQKVQVSLYGMSAKMNSSARDRGVRKAPFVVLIGATMPSILAEVGFVSNPHDEPLLKRAEQRQKIADALFKGIQQYSNTLSHVQMAHLKQDGE